VDIRLLKGTFAESQLHQKLILHGNTPCRPSRAKHPHGVRTGEADSPQFLQSVIDLDKETKTASVGKEISMEMCNSPRQTHALGHLCIWVVGCKHWVFGKKNLFY